MPWRLRTEIPRWGRSYRGLGSARGKDLGPYRTRHLPVQGTKGAVREILTLAQLETALGEADVFVQAPLPDETR